MLSKARNAIRVVQEAWRVSRVPMDNRIFSALSEASGLESSEQRGLHAYLEAYPALGRHEVRDDWLSEPESGDRVLTYDASLFAAGELRVRGLSEHRDILVFLPGHQMSSDKVFSNRLANCDLVAFARSKGLALACWDWPLQGERLNRCLFSDLNSVFSAEREYARILPLLGACLWREYVAELTWGLQQIARLAGPDRNVHVLGWSMGGAFAYLAPLLGTRIASAVSVGSCARFADLVREGKTRRHSYFFYPLAAVNYFDLDDVVGEVLASGQDLRVVYGDSDLGCLASTKQHLETIAANGGGRLVIDVVRDHGHVLDAHLLARAAEHIDASGTPHHVDNPVLNGSC